MLYKVPYRLKVKRLDHGGESVNGGMVYTRRCQRNNPTGTPNSQCTENTRAGRLKSTPKVVKVEKNR